jgi:hypothetical protein
MATVRLLFAPILLGALLAGHVGLDAIPPRFSRRRRRG